MGRSYKSINPWRSNSLIAAMPVRRSDRSDLDYRGHGPLLQKHPPLEEPLSYRGHAGAP